MKWTGHCLCGAVRYEAQGAPLYVSLCHCEDCRRASGAPFQGWVFFAKPNIHILSRALRVHCYEGRERRFCAACGSPEEIAAAFHFLASDDASYVNTAIIPVDGGITAGWNVYPLTAPDNVVGGRWGG
jgi:hypothetical protein